MRLIVFAVSECAYRMRVVDMCDERVDGCVWDFLIGLD